MKRSLIKIEMAGRFGLAAMAIALTVGAVSCATTATPEKTAAPTSQHATETGMAKPASADYYTCKMHPQVRSLDPDGKCPICQMALVRADSVLVVDPDSGKTKTAATFPAVSGYYSCPMHPHVLSRDPEGKCPDCNMPLLPVEDPVFH